jgi:hypothetical protein
MARLSIVPLATFARKKRTVQGKAMSIARVVQETFVASRAMP